MNPPLLELTDFCDKQKLCGVLVGENKKEFNSDLQGIEKLRNQLSHAATSIDLRQERADVDNLVLQFENARHWLTELTSLLGEPEQSDPPDHPSSGPS